MSNNLGTYAPVTVGTTAVQIIPAALITDWQKVPRIIHPKASISIQADPSNTGIIYVGSWLPAVTATQYARALNPGDWFTVAGSASDPGRIGIIGSASAQVAHISFS
jgi:hypothetical protein